MYQDLSRPVFAEVKRIFTSSVKEVVVCSSSVPNKYDQSTFHASRRSCSQQMLRLSLKPALRLE